MLAEAEAVMAAEDDKTVHSSGNAAKKSSSKAKKKKKAMTTEELLVFQKDQIAQEKAGKRKLFHSLVKLANELRRTRNESTPLVELSQYAERNWYEGGLWRAPALLPGVSNHTQRITRLREDISLTDLFFSLVIVTAFTRVGVAMTKETFVDVSSLLYFGGTVRRHSFVACSFHPSHLTSAAKSLLDDLGQGSHVFDAL
jgi:hypothetical protein